MRLALAGPESARKEQEGAIHDSGFAGVEFFFFHRNPRTGHGGSVPVADFIFLYGVLTVVVEMAGILLALRAVLMARTPQSAIGWALALVILPVIAIPLFLVFGESRFSGYTRAGTGGCKALDEALQATVRHLDGYCAEVRGLCADGSKVAQSISKLPPTNGNQVRLLVDGRQTFDAIFQAIDSAREAVWVQFFIIHDDLLGRELSARLLAAAARGVECLVMYDQVGSKKLPGSWCADLIRNGVRIQPFVTNRQFGRHFQINFRNHRKLLVVDGAVAFVGGLNAGDEYMGRSKKFGPWRDTHLRIEGPSVAGLQVSFLEDWNYATKSVPNYRLRLTSAGKAVVFPVSSGPAEDWNACAAVYLSVIQDAKRRLWLASPYFVPSSPLLYAICHAALRGVDVRIILPQMADHLLPWLSSFTYYPKLLSAGVKVWRYQPGFMHQKVLLADEDFAIVGSINLDYRSFMLNFELSAAVQDRAFAADVENMFLADFDRSRPEDLRAFDVGSFLFRVKCRAAALMSPEQ
ncbi:MAG: cardiolipin synthase [Terrimicrobiaceae bacterium]|nr:cardiolipin synthase [Terrimicrobiaceae bacterium]